MSGQFVLDTNAYALIFQVPRTDSFDRLKSKLIQSDVINFLLPEIVAMEIHSVVGKYRRGGAAKQEEKCSRDVVSGDGVIKCAQTCVWPARTRMNKKVFRALQKLMSDIEQQRGDIQGKLMAFGTSELNEAKRLLMTHAHQHAFGSHDALVAATVKVAMASGADLTIVTSDRGLKAVCAAENIKVFDPNRVP